MHNDDGCNDSNLHTTGKLTVAGSLEQAQWSKLSGASSVEQPHWSRLSIAALQ